MAILDSIASWETTAWLLGTLTTWPICRSFGFTPGLAASVEAVVVSYLLATIKRVPPASIVTWLVLVAIVPLGTTATTKSQHAVKANLGPGEMRILAPIEGKKTKGIKERLAYPEFDN